MLNRIIDGEISLKPVEAQDSESIFALTAANRLYLRNWLPWVDSTKSVEDTRKFVEACMAQCEQRAALHLCIRYRGEVAGILGFHYFDWPNRSASIGYWLSEHLQGKGIMTRSCREAIEFAFNEMGLNRIEIRCAVQNVRSRAIPERMHFTNEGTVRDAEWLYDRFVDLIIYGMLARQWPAGR